MREDMDKVLIDRPRFGRSLRKMNRMRAKQMAGNAPSKQGVRRQRWENNTKTKDFNDHLGPLRRYLAKQVGRPWNKVYSDISERIKPGHMMQEHLLEHVWGYVARPQIQRDGAWLWVRGDSGSPFGVWTGGKPHDGQLYIHPKDGLLKRWKAKPGEQRGKKRG
jgi:hypothetical protein